MNAVRNGAFLRLGFLDVNHKMTALAERYYGKSIFFGIAEVMMIVCCLLTALRTPTADNWRQYTIANCANNRLVCAMRIWISFIPTLCCRVLLGFVPISIFFAGLPTAHSAYITSSIAVAPILLEFIERFDFAASAATSKSEIQQRLLFSCSVVHLAGFAYRHMPIFFGGVFVKFFERLPFAAFGTPFVFHKEASCRLVVSTCV